MLLKLLAGAILICIFDIKKIGKFMEENELTKEQLDELHMYMNTMYGYLEMTKKIILPLDKLAYQTINDVISMSMISFGRKYHLEYDEEYQNKQNEKDKKNIEEIMNEINEGMDEE